MNSFEYTPDIVIYPFHTRYPNMSQLYHVRCERHPEFADCGQLLEMGELVEKHLEDHQIES